MLINRLKKIYGDDSGVAMTEILVAFVVLMLGFSMLYASMKLSSNMVLKTADTDREHAVYQKTAEENLNINSYPSSGSGSITYTFQSGYSLTLTPAKVPATNKSGNTRDIPVFAVTE